MRRAAHVLVSTFATAGVAYAEVPRSGATAAAAARDQIGEHVTIDQLVTAAVQRSPGLTMARASHDEARGRDAAADAVDEWHVFARFDGRDTILNRALAGPSVAVDARTVNAELGLKRSLWTGGDVTVSAATGQVRYL